jgi:hypothetical protein
VAGKRELIDTGTDKRYVRRDGKGQFTESDDVGCSLSKDVTTKAKTVGPSRGRDRATRAIASPSSGGPFRHPCRGSRNPGGYALTGAHQG